MPHVKTAIRYRWDDLPTDHPMDKITRRRIIGDQSMISHVHLEKGCIVPPHAHDNEQFAIVVSGRIRFGIGDADDPAYHELELGPGEVVWLPSNVLHSAEAVERTVVLDIFSPPSEATGIDRA